MAGSIPLTRHEVSPERAEEIRIAVRIADRLGESRLARPSDAPGFLRFVSDPAVHVPVYSLPRPLSLDAVEMFIETHIVEREAGIGLLFVREGEDGAIMGYSDIQVWPQWAAGELGGALHPSLHGKGMGAAGAAASFSWMFDTLGLDLLCETAAPDNPATARLLDGLGFRRMGQISSIRPDASTRASLVWEITRAEWAQRACGS